MTLSSPPALRLDVATAVRRGLAWLSRAALVLAAPLAVAQTAPLGCPLFHCTAEATGVMPAALVAAPTVVTRNTALGTLRAQGCSGNGTVLACLFGTDTATGTARGTLKLIDATTLLPYWGSTGTVGSQPLDARSAAGAQVPVVFASGQIAAGDKSLHALYSASGALISKVALTGTGSNYGLTPLNDTFGVVSQADGVLTLVNMSTWQAVGSPLVLTDATTGARLSLVSPSSASGGVLYAVAINPSATSSTNSGSLISVVLNPSSTGLRIRSRFSFDGETGASPVVVSRAASGLSANLVLLHVPGLNGDATNRLLGLKDNPSAGGFQTAWAVQLKQPLKVSPAIDEASDTLYIALKSDPRIYQYNFLTGAKGATFNLRTLGGLPSDFVVNGHVGGTQSGSVFTLLLSGSTATGTAPGQYMLALAPIASPGALLWAVRTGTTIDSFTAAWNVAPSAVAGVSCPVVAGPSNGLVRVCDF